MASVISEKFVEVPGAIAFRAFTNATSLREWLCDFATVQPRPRGRIYLWWNGDFYSSGHFEDIEENKKLVFRWFSSADALPTKVAVSFEEKNGGTQVRMEHIVPDEDSWKQIAEGFKQHWDSSLDNLKSVLETGIDRRIADRPMLGILPGDFTPEQATQLGVPVTEGARLDGTVEGMGAEQAGLKKDDVIVSMNGKPIKNDATSFQVAMAGKKGGDEVEVVFYHGSQKHTVTMQLSVRPMAVVPFDSGLLVMQAAPKYDAALKALQDCFNGVSDAEAAARPAEGEWSALDTLAHILQGEQGLIQFITELVGGYESVADGWGGNIDAAVSAFVATYPTVDEMMAQLRRTCNQTLELISRLPDDFAQNKGSFYRIGNWLLFNDQHFYSHIPQIKAAIEKAQS